MRETAGGEPATAGSRGDRRLPVEAVSVIEQATTSELGWFRQGLTKYAGRLPTTVFGGEHPDALVVPHAWLLGHLHARAQRLAGPAWWLLLVVRNP